MARSPSTLLAVLAVTLACAGAGPAAATVVEDFETGLPSGTDAGGVPVGFLTFSGVGSSVGIVTTASPPAPVPGSAAGNAVLALTIDSDNYAGVVYNFPSAGLDAWVSQDWSAYDALSLRVYGRGSGSTLFVDVLDNRNPGSTIDDAERWTTAFADDFVGWKSIQVPFATLARKKFFGSPDDGLGLTEVHGWAIGTETTPGALTFYVDDVRLVSSVPEPGALALFGAGLATVLAIRRRRTVV